MQNHFRGNISLIVIIVLIGILSILFFSKDKLFSQQKVTQNFQYQYLSTKFSLIQNIDKIENDECYKHQQYRIFFSNYSFHCQRLSIFLQKPTKSYVSYQKIDQYLNIDDYQSEIYQVQNLSELPNTSLEQPKIVQVLNTVDDALLSDFYGIIITDSYFDIKGKYNIYGVLYSSYDNKRKERNLSYKKEVIDNLEKKLTNWSYLPYSKSVLPNEETKN